MGECCRSLLSEIRSFIFLVEDNEGLMTETLNTLEKLRDRLQQNVPQEQGLPLLKSQIERNSKDKVSPLRRHKATISILNSLPYRIENVAMKKGKQTFICFIINV